MMAVSVFAQNEIGVFFTRIFLRILASANSTMQQKHVVLLVLLKIARRPQMLVDIFVNYDCYLNSEDIFERMVNEIANIAKGSNRYLGTDYERDQQEQSPVLLLALACLVTIMKSLVDWSKEIAEEETMMTEKNRNNNDDVQKLEDGEKEKAPEEVVIDTIDQTKRRKEELKRGKQLFNMKPRKVRRSLVMKVTCSWIFFKGIDYLVKRGHIERTPSSVAAFLAEHADSNLNKQKIGEYLGRIRWVK